MNSRCQEKALKIAITTFLKFVRYASQTLNGITNST